MTDRNGAFGSSAAPGGRWRVAVGGNRVENMTPEQIAEGYRTGQLTERTPLWPPGTSGWQALGNFSQFQSAAPGGQAHLSSYDEDEDDPTRMWTGPGDLDSFSPSGMPGGSYPAAPPPAPPAPAPRPAAVAPPAPPPAPPPAARPSPAQPAYPPAPAMSQRLTPGPSSSSIAFQPQARRSNGMPVVVGLLGLLGLGAALFAARGDLGEDESSATQAALAAQPTKEPVQPNEQQAPPSKAQAGDSESGSAKLAKFEAGAVKEVETSELKAAEPEDEEEADAKDEASGDDSSQEEDDDSATLNVKKKKAKRQAVSSKKKTKKRKRWSRSRSKKRSKKKASRRKSRSRKASSSSSKAKAASKPSSASSTPQSTNDAARAALDRSSKLASSCRPRGGPSGDGRARIVYAQDGSVQNVEILTARFRDTVTGNCVRMVFRRAKIPAFRGSAPTFIKSFTIPDN